MKAKMTRAAFRRPPVPTVVAASRHTGVDGWFPVDRFAAFDRPDTEAREPLSRAEALTEKGRELFEANPERAVDYHLQAAAIRLSRGHLASCVENYAAATDHYLKSENRRMAVAFARKLVHVAPMSPDARTRVKAYYLAARTYAMVGRKSHATIMVSKGAADAATLADVEEMRRGVELMEQIAAVHGADGDACACGKGLDYIDCCGLGDRDPVELMIRPERTSVGDVASDATLSREMAGIELMMAPRSRNDEPANWAAWRVEDGRHTLVSFPNWSGRALAAAKRMAALPEDVRDETSGPASAVLQAVCAAEAFLNSVAFFIREGGRSRWEGFGLPPILFDNPAAFYRTALTPRWRDISEALLGREWVDGSRLDDLRLLTKVRGSLVHFADTDHEEIIAPSYGALPDWLDEVPNGVELRGPPRPWIDRILTPSFATWAVDLVEELIASFRAEWALRSEKFEIDVPAGMYPAPVETPPPDLKARRKAEAARENEETERRRKLRLRIARQTELDAVRASHSVLRHISSRSVPAEGVPDE